MLISIFLKLIEKDCPLLTAVISRGSEPNSQIQTGSFRVVNTLHHVPHSGVLEGGREVQVAPQHLQEVVTVSTCDYTWSLTVSECNT